MDFSVEFYVSETGHCPVRDFLNGLKASDPNDFATIMAGLAKLRKRQYHHPPLSKAIGDGLLELRHVGQLNTRILYFFMRGRRIITVHAMRNKGWGIPAHDRHTAIKRMKDWLARMKP